MSSYRRSVMRLPSKQCNERKALAKEVAALIRCNLTATMLFGLLSASGPALSHPHIFAEARLDVVVDEDGVVQALRHLWRFDDLFSATVIIEFDKNGDLQLNEAELKEVSDVIYNSLNDFNYFQMVTVDGEDVEMERPEALMATMEDSQLIVFFEARPRAALRLESKVVFGIYDPTFYTAIDFTEDDYLSVENLPSQCSREVVRPDPDEAITENQNSLTEDFFTDPTDFSKIFATRLELTCPNSR